MYKIKISQIIYTSKNIYLFINGLEKFFSEEKGNIVIEFYKKPSERYTIIQKVDNKYLLINNKTGKMIEFKSNSFRELISAMDEVMGESYPSIIPIKYLNSLEEK